MPGLGLGSVGVGLGLCTSGDGLGLGTSGDAEGDGLATGSAGEGDGLGDATGPGLGRPCTLYTATTVTAPSSCRVMLALGEESMSSPVVALYTSQRTKLAPAGATCVRVYRPAGTRPSLPHRPSPGCCTLTPPPMRVEGASTQLPGPLALMLAVSPL